MAPLGISLFLGLAMVGLTVAKRHDLITAAESMGLLRPTAARRRGARRPADPRRHERDHRRPDRGHRRLGLPVRDARGAAVRARRGPAPRRQLGHAAPDPRPARPRDPGPHAQDRHDARSIVIDEDVPDTPEVDSKLVALAKRNGRAVLTNDLNLNRIADLQGVRVLNVNSLANAVKPALLPGEDLRVRVIQPGKDAGQGVGYLDDGTMVVVEGGAKSIDTEVDVTVTRVLQTVAGRMVFAHPRQG